MTATEQKSVVALTFTVVILLLAESECKQKEIIVIGGGISGLAAARTLRNNRKADYHVTVYEARRDRYGGRVWTDKKSMPDAIGVEADLGAAALNTLASDNPLLNLTDKFELKTTKLGPLQLFVQKLDKRFSGSELVEHFIEARKLYIEAIAKAKEKTVDQSVRSAVSEVVSTLRGQGQVENEVVASILELLPSYNMADFSAKLYQGDMLDFGYNVFLKDGMGELMDRLVSGGDGESPLSIELRKVVRQLQVDAKNKKVIVRLRDGSQTKADVVVVAVPASVLRDESLMFEPALPPSYTKALKEMGTYYGNKVVVEFSKVFWPTDMGVFLMSAGEKDEAGLLQKWANMHKLVGRPVLMGFIGGPASLKYENMTDDEVKTVVRERLTALFGSAAQETDIVKLLRSGWKKMAHSEMSSSYPRVGSDIKIWNMFAEPLCPYIYFAGEHTTYKGLGALHGAYNSGVRAAEQIMSELCEERAREEERKRQLEEQERKKREKELEEKKGKRAENAKLDAKTETRDEL